MARVSRIKKSRVERTCHRGHVIPVGSAYSFAAPGFRGREIYACTQHPFRASHLTTGLRAEPEAAREAFQDAVEGIDHASTSALEDLTAALEDLTAALEEYVSQRQEALDAWEYGNSTLEELLDTAQAAFDELDSLEVEEWDGDESLLEGDLPDEPEEPAEGGEDDTDATDAQVAAYEDWSTAHDEWEDAIEEIEEARASWAAHVEDQINSVSEVVEGLEF